ncbi:MAG: DUF771 domain-containing protein [Carnobacterium sp.]|uniref:DUF771 domain-containing protein n=1 Tax=Carnobacterium sp. TaxID=48221 RepID=UPI003C714D7C
MQQQTVELNILWQVPADSIIIKKSEYEELVVNSLSGETWTMKDLERKTKKRAIWLRKNVLDVPEFKEILDVENGGCVFYPDTGTGERWAFQALRMSNFLDENFPNIYITRH